MYPTIAPQVYTTDNSDENYFADICSFHSDENCGSGVRGFTL